MFTNKLFKNITFSKQKHIYNVYSTVRFMTSGRQNKLYSGKINIILN